jgi:hypothetical protein
MDLRRVAAWVNPLTQLRGFDAGLENLGAPSA